MYTGSKSLRQSTWMSFILWGVLSCAKPLHRFPDRAIIPGQSSVSFDVNVSPVDSFKILYLGCGHLIVTWHGESFVTDPFVSTQPFLKTAFGKIQLDRSAYAKFDSIVNTHEMDLQSVKSVWVAHSHYDHLLDLPLMLEKNVYAPEVKIYGHEFTGKIMKDFIDRHAFHELVPSAVYCPTGSDTSYRWFYASRNVRVMPVHSNHAAHAKILFFKICLMKGKLKEEYFRNHFTSIDSRTRSKQWREGCTYSFLVDFLEADSVVLRLFIQTSASDYPWGAPPGDLIRQHPVDLAILCAASTGNVRHYPERIMKHLGAEKLLLIHWEDFFRKSLEFNDPRLVRLTSFKRLSRRLRKWNPDVSGNTLMPRPGTLVKVRY